MHSAAQFRIRALAWLAMVWVVTGSASATAASVETLLMPGKVSSAHAKLEETCTNCHDRSNVRTQTSLCLACHKEIAADQREHRGYHGRMLNATLSECRACHTEHKGRAADIVRLEPAHFDHQLTELPLRGAHIALACEACHKPGKTFRALPATCVSCHNADDVHHGQFTQSCGDCHGAADWGAATFHHEQTRFALSGAHTAVACNACHIAGRYKPTPSTCAGCHATDDVHRGTRGSDCARCHVTKEWKTAKFDHLKETGYPLLGAHADLDCLACHRSGNYKEAIPKDCNGCHRADDAHAARFGTRCETCHDNSQWPVSQYDHSGRNKFPLIGAHAAIACDACHTAEVAHQKLGESCVDCHRAADPHGGKLHEACDSCHGQMSWNTGLTFDHALTRFPLVGLHRPVSCAQCHATLAFTETSNSCIDCHKTDDVHKGGLGAKCASCHSANGWTLWNFDHGKETHFPLRGAHARLQCADCHTSAPGTVKMAQECGACHQKDDRHLGQYGLHCERCHNADSWKGARIQ